MAARVFSVIDVWDALHSERPYRKAWPNENTRTYLTSLSGKQFDPPLVDTFFNIVLKVAEAFKL